MSGRLLDCLQQGIECLRRKVMNLVDDVDLVPADHRQVFGRLNDLMPYFVNARFARGVHLDHVDATSGCNRSADFASVVWLCAWSVLAIEGFRKQASRGGFAGSARSGEKIAVRHATGRDRILERPDDVVLPYQVRKRLTSIFPVERDVGHFI